MSVLDWEAFYFASCVIFKQNMCCSPLPGNEHNDALLKVSWIQCIKNENINILWHFN